MQGTGENLDEMFHHINRMRKAWEQVSPSKQLNKSQFTTLFALARLSGYYASQGKAEKPVTLSALAGAMHQSLPALSQRVTALEEKGFLDRVADKADRRVTGLRLTETGRREMDAAFCRFNAILSQAAASVGKENMCTLLRLLDEFAGALNEAAREMPEQPEE